MSKANVALLAALSYCLLFVVSGFLLTHLPRKATEVEFGVFYGFVMGPLMGIVAGFLIAALAFKYMPRSPAGQKKVIVTSFLMASTGLVIGWLSVDPVRDVRTERTHVVHVGILWGYYVAPLIGSIVGFVVVLIAEVAFPSENQADSPK